MYPHDAPRPVWPGPQRIWVAEAAGVVFSTFFVYKHWIYMMHSSLQKTHIRIGPKLAEIGFKE